MSPTHRVNFLIDCADGCKEFPTHCDTCLKNRFIAAGIPFREFEMAIDADESQAIESARDIVARKYQDVLNIKCVLVLDKTGLCLYNHPVTGASEMDGNLIAGFIQANLSFSKMGVATTLAGEPTEGANAPSAGQDPELKFLDMRALPDAGLVFSDPQGNGNQEKIESSSQRMFELNYLEFVLLVHESKNIRSVLILDHFPSYSLRNLLVAFTDYFERIYNDVLENFTGNVTQFEDAHLVVEKVFETDLLYPYTARMISPTEENSLSGLERIVYKHGLDQAQRKGFFFIATIVESIKNALQKPSRDVIHAVYELVKIEYFTPEKIDSAARYLEEVQLAREALEKEKTSISGISSTVSPEEINSLKERVRGMPEKDARALLKKYMSTAASRLGLGIYDDACYQYELAKIVASEAALTKEIQAIQSRIDEIVNMTYTVEYDNSMKIAVAAEKNKDFLKAIQHYTTCKNILLEKFQYLPTHKRLLQIEKRIFALQEKAR